MDAKTRYTLTVPKNDNDGNSLADLHEIVQDNLGRFEGFSSWEGVGYWGGEHAGSEPVIYYVIDVGEQTPVGAVFEHPLMTLRSIALYVKVAGKQDAVYLTRQSIDVELI